MALPTIRFVLPEYSDEDVWAFILQYLKAAGFDHTAQGFRLELLARGVTGERFQDISEVI